MPFSWKRSVVLVPIYRRLFINLHAAAKSLLALPKHISSTRSLDEPFFLKGHLAHKLVVPSRSSRHRIRSANILKQCTCDLTNRFSVNAHRRQGSIPVFPAKLHSRKFVFRNTDGFLGEIAFVIANPHVWRIVQIADRSAGGPAAGRCPYVRSSGAGS